MNASLQLLGRLRDLSRSAHAALDAGDTDGALVTIERRTALLERERETIEWLVAAHASQTGSATHPTAEMADQVHAALGDALEQHSLLTTRLAEAHSGVAGELAHLETGQRTIRAYRARDRERGTGNR